MPPKTEHKIDRNAPAGTENSLGEESIRDGRPSTDDSVVEAIDEEGPGISPIDPPPLATAEQISPEHYAEQTQIAEASSSPCENPAALVASHCSHPGTSPTSPPAAHR